MTVYEAAQSIIFSAKLGIAVSIMNMIASGLLIYGALQLRKGTKALQAWQARLEAQTEGS